MNNEQWPMTMNNEKWVIKNEQWTMKNEQSK